MRQLTLPGTDLTVSQMCLGAAELGSRSKGADAERLVAEFYEADGRFYDTAHVYAFWLPGGLGASERELGRCLHALGIRDRVVVGTKGGHPDCGEGYRRPDRYLDPSLISRDIDESLDRLGDTAIDLYYLHRDDTRVPVSEIMDCLNREIASGRLRHIAASNWSVARIAEANELAAVRGLRPFVASQVQWSLAVPNWRATDDPTVRYVTGEDARAYAASGLPVVAYSASANGFFAGPTHEAPAYTSEENRVRRAEAAEIATEIGATATQVALAWLLHQDGLVIPLFSTLRSDHLAEAVGASAIVLSDSQMARLGGSRQTGSA